MLGPVIHFCISNQQGVGDLYCNWLSGHEITVLLPICPVRAYCFVRQLSTYFNDSYQYESIICVPNFPSVGPIHPSIHLHYTDVI